MIKVSRWSFLVLAGLLISGLSTSRAQTQNGVDILLSKARSLESRGRIDLASQNWRQVLLVNANQTEALAGLARYAKETGNAEEERTYLDRLRKINPKDPAIASIERLHVPTAQERERLDQAGRLALQHQPDAAMKIYHDVFGEEPPLGKWAWPFYEAEAASTGGREKAIAQLRRLCVREPANEVFRLWLALVLTYNPKTRMEGFRQLESIQEPGAVEQARAPWRQALLWEKDNPAVQSSLEAYLRHYPDPELQTIFSSLREKEAHDLAEANKERGFQALQNKDLGAAQTKFEAVLRHSPNDANAIAGLGFVRLNQKRFSEALSLFERARQLAPQRTEIREGYDNARFWLAMQQGSIAVQQNNTAAAIAGYQEALGIRPQDQDALVAIAQALARAKRFPDAEVRFQQVLLRSPSNVDARAGLGFIRLNQGKFDEAQQMLGEALRLAPSRKDIDEGYRNAKYWGVMKHGADALGQNHVDAAITDYQQALSLSPGAKDAWLGLADAKERKGSYADAIQAYGRVTASDANDVRAWLGLMRAQIAARDANGALTTSQRIPEPTRQQIENRSDYLAELALAYYSVHQPSEGDRAMRRALDAGNSSDTEEALNVRLAVAGLLIDQGNTERAIAIYKQATTLHPNNAIAWEGLVGSYTRVHDFPRALATMRAMPENAYASAAKDASFLISAATAYSAEGQCAEAEDFLRRSISLDRSAGRQPAEGTLLELADIWMREGQYGKAIPGYRAILDRNANSVDAWRGYIAALHKNRADQTVVSELQRIPTPVRTQLEKDANFLVLEASAHQALGNNEQVVQLLGQARSHYSSKMDISAADLDVQRAWAMAATSQHDQELQDLLAGARTRSDVTGKQREAFAEIWSIWSVHRAQLALDSHQPSRSIEILIEADRQLPRDRRIQSALGATYMRQHEYRKALSVYEAWNMNGATAGDYRSAAGAALAVHQDSLADHFLETGLQHWPRDPELLRMAAKQEVARGKYDDAQRDLQSALAATRNPETALREDAQNVKRQSAASADPVTRLPAASPALPACRSTISDNVPGNVKPMSTRSPGRARLINAAWVQSSTAGQSTVPAQSQSAAPIQSPTPAQSQERRADSTQEGRIQDEIDVVQNRNTPFSGFGDAVTGRTGDPGFGRLIIEDGALSDSITYANKVRFSIEAHGVYLFSGSPNGGPSLQLGTLPQGAAFAEQKEFGLAGEGQLSTNTFGLAFGTSPQGFPTHNLVGGIRFRPANGPLTFMFERDSIRDSLLSYAGVRDPGTGQVWGGVVANTGSLQLSHDVRGTGQYAGLDYGFIQGTNVPDNWKVGASAGVYWRVVKGLSFGLAASGMHYDKNLSFFSLGQGGYFSPQQYYVASIPVSWFARHRRFEYTIRAGLGVQYVSEDSSPFFPTQPQLSPNFYSSQVHTGPNYNVEVRVGYRIAPRWYLDLYGTGNNAQNFATQTIGFNLKFLMHRLPTDTDLHVKSIPDWKGRQPFGIE